MPENKKRIKAWAFLTSDGNFIPMGEYDRDDIYLKKPMPQRNPFNYFSDKPSWKPTKIIIEINKDARE